MDVLAVTFLMGLVLGVALDFYTDLSRATQRATEHTRGVRKATAILDRVARDIEVATLATKPPEVDPLEHPWLFLAESRYAHGASDHLKFVIRNHRPKREDVHESDLAVVTYTVRNGEADDYELLRWSSPRLPEGLDRDFPPDDEAQLLADGLAAFGLRFLDESGEWATTWDSSQLADSSELPLAVEIRVALQEELADEFDEPEPYTRTVVIPVRPLDYAALLDPSQQGLGDGSEDEEEEDEDGEDGDSSLASGECQGPTVAECFNMQAAQAANDQANIQAWANSGDCFAQVGHLVSAQYVLPRCR